MKKLLIGIGAGCVGLGLILATVAAFFPQGSAKLSWQRPVVRKSIHTFAYKVYANPRLSDGRFFLSKLVLRNDGDRSVRDFSVSYEIPGYVSRTTPKVLPEIPPGHTVVELFYPQLSESVTKIKNLTTATLQIFLQWKDGAGAVRDEILRENFNFRGVNEIEYTDLPADEIVTTYDKFLNDELLAAMVTPNDPVVAEFAAAITERLGGAVAGAGGAKEAVEVMRGTYDYMVATGMRYAGAQGVPEERGDVRTLVQTIRLPRDVITTNNGLCIELALLWASVLEHLGLKTYVELVPGHAFVGVASQGNFIPVECTAITPKAVGAERPVSFDEAVKMAMKTADDVMKSGAFHHELDVGALQTAGIRPPELPDIDVDKIKSVLASRKNTGAAGRQRAEGGGGGQGAGGGGGSSAQPPAGFQTYTAPNNLLQFAYPAAWQHGPPNNRAVPQLIFAAMDPKRTTIGMEVYYTPQERDPDRALRSIVNSYARIGVNITYGGRDVRQNGIYYTGTSTGSGMQYVWIALFRPSDKGCAGIVIGVSAQALEAQKGTIEELVKYVRFP